MRFLGLILQLEPYRVHHPPRFHQFSLKQVLQQTFDIEVVLKELCYYIEKRYMQFKAGHFEKIDADYHASLYHFQQMKTFQVGDKRFEAQILGVDETGKIKLLNDGDLAVYAVGEVEFIS